MAVESLEHCKHLEKISNIVIDGVGAIGKMIGAKDEGLASIGKKRDSTMSSKDGPKDNICRLHKNAQSIFVNLDDELPVLQETKAKLEQELLNLQSEYDNMTIPDFNMQNKIYILENELINIKDIIQKIINKTDEKQYLLKTGPIITKFKKLNDIEHDIMERTSKIEFNNQSMLYNQNDSIPLTPVISACNSNNINDKPMTALELMKQRKKARKTGKELPIMSPVVGNILDIESGKSKMCIRIRDNKPLDNTEPTPCMKEIEEIRDLIRQKKSEKMNKKRLYDQYMRIINKDYISRDVGSRNKSQADLCNVCQSEMATNQSTGMLHCTNCGRCEKILIDSDKQSHKEPPKEQTNFSYRRINHLNEVLSQIQAKESTNIPDRVYEKFREELKKRRITDLSKLNNQNGHDILKTIGEADYYEHVPYIVSQLNGKAPPTISPEIEEIIRGLFMHTQHPFSKYCPEDRNNFVTYNFTLYKLFQLLELDELLPNIKESLKDRSKQYYQDRLWKKICAELKWQYIPTE